MTLVLRSGWGGEEPSCSFASIAELSFGGEESLGMTSHLWFWLARCMLTTSCKFTEGKYLDSLSIYVTIRKLVCPFLSRTRSSLYIMAYLHLGASVLQMNDHRWFWDVVCCRDVRVRGGNRTVLFLPRGFRGFGTKHGIRTDEVFQLPPSGLMTTKISDQKK